mmetsp:Transcript_13823/g.60372  ORF Transcript_13823/g.60372 Transcript_13823/m.60372 type:complete len:288 (-) Transcript_13823:1445-2308(-)
MFFSSSSTWLKLKTALRRNRCSRDMATTMHSSSAETPLSARTYVSPSSLCDATMMSLAMIVPLSRSMHASAKSARSDAALGVHSRASYARSVWSTPTCATAASTASFHRAAKPGSGGYTSAGSIPVGDAAAPVSAAAPSPLSSPPPFAGGGRGSESACLTSVAARILPTGGASRILLLENRDLTRFSSSSAASCLHVTPTTAACTCVCCSRSITAYSSVCLGRCANRSNSSSTKTTPRRPFSSTLSISRINATFSAKPAALLNSSSSALNPRHSCSAISLIATRSSA